MKNLYLILILTFSCCKIQTQTADSSFFSKCQQIQYFENCTQFTFDLDYMTPMPEPNYGFGAVKLKNQVYTFFWNGVYTYDIAVDKWSLINNTGMKNDQVNAVLGDSIIYLVGGYHEGNKIERFNINTNKWQKPIIMPLELYWCAVEYLDNHLFIIVGYSHPNLLNHILNYNVNTNTWKKHNLGHTISDPNSFKIKNEIFCWGRQPGETYPDYTPVFLKYNILKDSIYYDIFLANFVKDYQEGTLFKGGILFSQGSDGGGFINKASKSLYWYDPQKCIYYESITKLKEGRHYDYFLFEHKGDIYLMGGRDDQTWDAMNTVLKISKIKLPK